MWGADHPRDRQQYQCEFCQTSESRIQYHWHGKSWLYGCTMLIAKLFLFNHIRHPFSLYVHLCVSPKFTKTNTRFYRMLNSNLLSAKQISRNLIPWMAWWYEFLYLRSWIRSLYCSYFVHLCVSHGRESIQCINFCNLPAKLILDRPFRLHATRVNMKFDGSH